MPITYDWYMENHIVKVDFHGAVSIEDLAGLSDNMIALFESAALNTAGKVHIIIDEGNVTDPPKKVWEVVRNVGFVKHKKMGWLLLYGNEDPFIKFLSPIVAQVAGVKHRYVADFEMALRHLETADLTIQWES